ncbi:MAG: hypothetical protein VKJ46_06430 [Leptolyngbyaceae bacterium]|nr:hypothetical protein [Leptolyngbyaceae bacterium]
MKTIEEVFRELDWEDEQAARQARDARSAELQSQGYLCRHENLYAISGHRVFLLTATEEPEILPPIAATQKSTRPRVTSGDRPFPAYETR